MSLKSFRTFTFLLVLCLLLITSLRVNAKVVATIGADPPDCRACAECSKCASPSNYISGSSSIGIAEGNLRDSYDVVSIKSAFGTTLDLSLEYNSYNADDSRAALDTVMGFGWTHSYNIFLFSQSGNMFRMDGSGRVTKYLRNMNGTFATAPGYFETLVQLSVSDFTITTKEKTIYTFALIANTPFSVNGPVYRLTSIADRNNNVTSLVYANGNLASVTDTFGRSLTLVHNGQNKLISITDPLMRTTTLEYDPTGTRLLKITDPGNRFIQYSYNSIYQLTGKIDKDNNGFTYLYENQKPVAIVDGAGAYLFHLTNTQNWATDANELAVNQVRVYLPATTAKSDGRSNISYYTYDSNGYINLAIARDQVYVFGKENSDLSFLRLWPRDGTTTRYAYDPITLKVALTIDSDGHSSSNTYDALGNNTSASNSLGQLTTYTYEPVHSQMTTMTDPNGRITTYENDIRGNRTRETDPVGNTREWTFDIHGNVLTTKDKNGNQSQTVYDPSGNRMMVTEAVGSPAQRATILTHDSVGNELTRTNANAHTTIFGRDSLNRLTHVTDAAGKITQIVYNGMGNPVQRIDRTGKSTTFLFDLRQRHVKTTDALGQMTIQTYDNENNLASITDKNGHISTYQYTVRNWPVRITDALNNQTTRTYNGTGEVLTEKDANGHITTNEYDTLRRRVKMTDAVGSTTLYRYDMVGLSGCAACTGPTLGSNLVTKQTDCNGKVIYFKYDSLDRLILEIHKEGDTADTIDPSDAVTRYTYDPNGNRLTLTEPNGNTTSFNYDSMNRLIKHTNGAGDMTTYAYDGDDNLVTRTDPNTNVITNTYDALDRLVQVDDLVGRVANYTYDFEDNKLSETDGNANTTLRTYDAIYRVIKVTDPMGEQTQFQYDPVGNLIKVTDREGRINTTIYDAINRRTSTTNALGHTTGYEYDHVGNLVKMTDAKPVPGITQYQYDAENRLVKEINADPPPNTRNFTYDCVGNLITRTDQKGQTTTYNYNDLYFLLKRDYPVSADENMTYDLSGRMLTAERGGWLVTFNYDGADRVSNSTQNGKTVNYVYDIPGRRRTLTYPGGRNITEQMDLRDRKTGISDGGSPPIAQYTYDLGDRITTRTYRNGTIATYSYNANDWTLSLEHSLGVTRIAGFGQTFDKEGNKRREEKRHDLPLSEFYEYDAAYRLTNYKVSALAGVPRPLTQTAYNLDAVGNWTGKVTDRVVQSRTHNAANEITSIAGAPLINDNNGNLTDDVFYRYAYDEENRLTSVTRISDNQVVGQYQYDALGRRVKKVVNPGGTPTDTRFFYDENRIIEEQGPTGLIRATYVFGNYVDETLTMDRGGQTYYYHQNALWSVAAVTGGAGNVVERYRYDAYGSPVITDGVGNPLGSISAIGNPWMFTGRQFDEESGLYFYRTRYLDPNKGRFTTRDAVGIWRDRANMGNGYGYVGSNPIGSIDPLGLYRIKGWNWTVEQHIGCALFGAATGGPWGAAVYVGCLLTLNDVVHSPPPDPKPDPPPALTAPNAAAQSKGLIRGRTGLFMTATSGIGGPPPPGSPEDCEFHPWHEGCNGNPVPILPVSMQFGGGGGFNGGGAGGTWRTTSMVSQSSMIGGTSPNCRFCPLCPECPGHICTIIPEMCLGQLGGSFGGTFVIANIKQTMQTSSTNTDVSRASQALRNVSSYLDPCGPWGTPETCDVSLDPRHRGWTW